MGEPLARCCWLPVAGLVVGFAQTDAGAPISATALPRNSRPSHQSLIGLTAASPTISTATTAHTTTMVSPRRRSAAFCFARICSTTFCRSLRAVFDLDDLAMVLSLPCSRPAGGMVRASLRSDRSQPNSGRIVLRDPPAVGVGGDAGGPTGARIVRPYPQRAVARIVQTYVVRGRPEQRRQDVAQVAGVRRAAERGPVAIGPSQGGE